MAEPELREAIALARAGQLDAARARFIAIVTADEENERAWLWLGVLAEDVEDQIIALENALLLNPANRRAAERLERLQAAQHTASRQPPPQSEAAYQPSGTDLLLQLPPAKAFTAARQYEVNGEWQEAHLLYEQIAALAPERRLRQAAQKRLSIVQRQQQLQAPLAVHTTFTLLRLGLGPPLLYLILIFVQAAFRPYRLSPILCLGGVVLLAGSLLLVGTRVTPAHPVWQRLLKDRRGLRGGAPHLVLTLLALTLILLPYLAFFLSAYLRLTHYQPPLG